MRRSSVLLARVLAFIDVNELAPDGSVHFVELVREIAERYSFLKSPKSIEEFDLAKGVEFLEGSIGRKPISKLVIWSNLIVLETQSNTDESKRTLEEMLLWGAQRFGLAYKADSISRFAYISDVAFYSDAHLLNVNPALDKLQSVLDTKLTEMWQEPVEHCTFHN